MDCGLTVIMQPNQCKILVTALPKAERTNESVCEPRTIWTLPYMDGMTIGAEMRYVPPLRSSIAPPRSVMLEAIVCRGPRGDRSAATAFVMAVVESVWPVGSAPYAIGVIGVVPVVAPSAKLVVVLVATVSHALVGCVALLTGMTGA